jgi:gluconokinase
MKSGIGLNDQQRLPWLEKLYCLLSDWTNNGTNGILSCSALKASYRQILNNGVNKNRAVSNLSIKYILLFLSYDSVCERLKSRSHEFIKDTSILKGQFKILEYGSDSDPSTMFTHITDCENKSIDDVVDELKRIVKSDY